MNVHRFKIFYSFLQQAGSQVTAEQVTKEMLLGIVKHFQELFDVPRISGVYTRMSDIYRKLGETHNVLQTLKDFLGLGSSFSSSIFHLKILYF